MADTSPSVMPVSSRMRSAASCDTGRSSTTAHVGIGHLGSATARMTSRVPASSAVRIARRRHVVGDDPAEAVAGHPLGQRRRGIQVPPGPGRHRQLHRQRARDARGARRRHLAREARHRDDRRSTRRDSATRRSIAGARASRPAPRGVAARCTSSSVVCARNCAWSVSDRMRDCTRYELTLKNSSSPASRKKRDHEQRRAPRRRRRRTG